MTLKQIFLLIFILFSNVFFGQSKYHKVEMVNSTGRNVRLQQIMYDKDSLKTGHIIYFCSKCSSKGDDESYFKLLRLDIIAIDDSTKDTICIKSYSEKELQQDKFIINVDNTKRALVGMPTPNCLLIKSKGDGYVYKINSIMAIKTTNGRLEGKLKSFDSHSFIIIDEKGKEHNVDEKSLIGIKGCGPLIASGPYFNMFNHCNYDKLEKPNFKVARQDFNYRKNEWTWQDVK